MKIGSHWTLSLGSGTSADQNLAFKAMWQPVVSWLSEGQGWSLAKVIAKGSCLRMKEASQLQTCTSYFKWWPDTANQRDAGKLKKHHQGK